MWPIPLAFARQHLSNQNDSIGYHLELLSPSLVNISSHLTMNLAHPEEIILQNTNYLQPQSVHQLEDLHSNGCWNILGSNTGNLPLGIPSSRRNQSPCFETVTAVVRHLQLTQRRFFLSRDQWHGRALTLIRQGISAPLETAASGAPLTVINAAPDIWQKRVEIPKRDHYRYTAIPITCAGALTSQHP